MKRLCLLALFALIAAILPIGGAIVGASSVPVTLYYGDIMLPSTFGSFAQMGLWDLNAGPVTIRYTLDLSGAPNIAYDSNWNNMGIVGLFSGGSGARMCGFLCDWENSGSKFPIYPDKPNTLDMDDKFNMQRFPNPGSYDEQMYDVNFATSPPTIGLPGFNPWLNYGVWFDRDGVDPYQPGMWGMVDGGTYNTSGAYDVGLTFSRFSSTQGIVCARMFPDLANTWDLTGYGIGTGFYTVWKPTGPDYYPTGISFDTDEAKMGSMQVFVEGSSDGGSIIVKDLAVTGYLVLDEGMATGGGWFIAESNGNFVGTTPGGKATFGFVAKRKNETSSGQLEFQYHADGLNLKSASYDWVSVASVQVMFEGEGVLNGVPGYRFRVWAFDGDKAGGQPDRFTIRIWTGSGSYESPTYRAEGDLGGGQVVVHKK